MCTNAASRARDGDPRFAPVALAGYTAADTPDPRVSLLRAPRLDDDSCMEVTALKGSSGDVQHFADHIIAERGVRYGRVVMIPTSTGKRRSVRDRKHQHN